MTTYEGTLDGTGLRVGIVCARFNEFVVEALLAGARRGLRRHGVADDAVDVAWVPGAYEIPLAAKAMAESGRYDAVVHARCPSSVAPPPTSSTWAGPCASTLASLQVATGVPVMFGVLTVDTIEAGDRALGHEGRHNGARRWRSAPSRWPACSPRSAGDERSGRACCGRDRRPAFCTTSIGPVHGSTGEPHPERSRRAPPCPRRIVGASRPSPSTLGVPRAGRPHSSPLARSRRRRTGTRPIRRRRRARPSTRPHDVPLRTSPPSTTRRWAATHGSTGRPTGVRSSRRQRRPVRSTSASPCLRPRLRLSQHQAPRRPVQTASRPAETVCRGRHLVTRSVTGTRTAASRIDRRLRTDMRRQLLATGPWLWQRCLTWAETFYRAVRVAGGRDGSGGDGREEHGGAGGQAVVVRGRCRRSHRSRGSSG